MGTGEDEHVVPVRISRPVLHMSVGPSKDGDRDGVISPCAVEDFHPTHVRFAGTGTYQTYPSSCIHEGTTWPSHPIQAVQRRNRDHTRVGHVMGTTHSHNAKEEGEHGLDGPKEVHMGVYEAENVERALKMNKSAIAAWKTASEELWEQNVLLDRMLRRVEKDLSEANQMLAEQRRNNTELRQENEKLRVKMAQKEHIVQQMDRLRFLFGDEVIDEQLELEESIREQYSPVGDNERPGVDVPTSSSKFYDALNELEGRANTAEQSAQKLLGMLDSASGRWRNRDDTMKDVARNLNEEAGKENIEN